MPSVGLMTRTLRYAFKAASVPASCNSFRREVQARSTEIPVASLR